MSAEIDGVLAATDHRPWPLPRGPWILFQRWRHLLFAHWPVPRALLRPLVPGPLALDEHDGSSWVGLVPFRIEGLRPRALPPLPGAACFLELNLRTYVTAGGKPGVYFFSLDAASRLAVAGARLAFGLPYHLARMRSEPQGAVHDYRSRRRKGSADLVCRYRPTGAERGAEGGLEQFLVERYALYVVRAGRTLRTDIHHAPWRLRPAELEIERETVASAAGIRLPDRAPLVHFAEPQATLAWTPAAVSHV